MEQKTVERIVKGYTVVFFFILMPLSSFSFLTLYAILFPAGKSSYHEIMTGLLFLVLFVLVISIIEGVLLLRKVAWSLGAAHLFFVLSLFSGIYSVSRFISVLYPQTIPFVVASVIIASVIIAIMGLFGIYLFAFNRDIMALFQPKLEAKVKS